MDQSRHVLMVLFNSGFHPAGKSGISEVNSNLLISEVKRASVQTTNIKQSSLHVILKASQYFHR